MGSFYLLVTSVLTCIQLLDIYHCPPQPVFYFSMTNLWISMSMLCLSLIALLESFYLDQHANSHYVYIYILLLELMIIFTCFYSENRRWLFFLSTIWVKNKSGTKLCQYVYSMMTIIDRVDIPYSKDTLHMELSQFLTLHTKSAFYPAVKEIAQELLLNSMFQMTRTPLNTELQAESLHIFESPRRTVHKVEP